ncbi:MAG: hypothetical protein WC744_00550 [Patescibacteria group bacterium]|jgi:hypothetical protein
MENLISPVKLPDKAIKEFQDLMLKHFRSSLSFEQAKKRAQEFINFFMVISQPISKSLSYQK